MIPEDDVDRCLSWHSFSQLSKEIESGTLSLHTHRVARIQNIAETDDSCDLPPLQLVNDPGSRPLNLLQALVLKVYI